MPTSATKHLAHASDSETLLFFLFFSSVSQMEWRPSCSICWDCRHLSQFPAKIIFSTSPKLPPTEFNHRSVISPSLWDLGHQPVLCHHHWLRSHLSWDMGHSVFTYSFLLPPLLLLALGTFSCQVFFVVVPLQAPCWVCTQERFISGGKEKKVLVQTVFTWSDMLLTPKEEARLPSPSPECSKNRVRGLPDFSPKKEQWKAKPGSPLWSFFSQLNPQNLPRFHFPLLSRKRREEGKMVFVAFKAWLEKEMECLE